MCLMRVGGETGVLHIMNFDRGQNKSIQMFGYLIFWQKAARPFGLLSEIVFQYKLPSAYFRSHFLPEPPGSHVSAMGPLAPSQDVSHLPSPPCWKFFSSAVIKSQHHLWHGLLSGDFFFHCRLLVSGSTHTKPRIPCSSVEYYHK